MSETENMRQQASYLRKERRYAEALPHYEELWTNRRTACDKWDGWGYAFSLRKLVRPQEALAVSSDVRITDPDFEYNNGLYTWCVYDTEIGRKTDDQIKADEARFFRAAEDILRVPASGPTSARARTVFRVVDYLDNTHATYPAQDILDWLDRLAPDELSDSVGTGKDERGKDIAYASDREKWYAARSKALLILRRYEECLSVCEEALGHFITLHFGNDVWFRWRAACAKGELGDKEIAVNELKALLARKSDWFIQDKIAEYLYDLGRNDDSLRYAVDAALGPGDLEKKWKVMFHLGRVFEALGKHDEAQKHTLLAAKTYEEQGWKMPAELRAAVEAMSLDVAAAPPSGLQQKQLTSLWQTLKFGSLPKAQGVIAKLLPSGKDGIIQGKDGKSYYFRLGSFQGPRGRLAEGLAVSFAVEKNPDPTKRDIAVNIEEIKP